MEYIVVLAALVALCSSSAIPTAPEAIPTVPGDNSHYVQGQSRYIWVPDNDGKPHLVDLHKPVDEDFLKTRSGADNTYWLLSRENPITPQEIVHNDLNSVRESNYRAGRPLVVIVHSWGGYRDCGMNYGYAYILLLNQNVNVILLDWESVAAGDYNTAAAGVYDVGDNLGKFLVWLIENGGGDWNNVHILGFSMGGQVLGPAGRAADGRIGRITGLDPAGPLWVDVLSANALNSTHAQYVEAIHTDGGNMGIFTRSGDVDFYVNGGREPQAGCELGTVCSHMRAVDYFESTLWYNSIVGRECADMAQAMNMECTGREFNMGNSHFGKRGSGIYGVTTTNLWPFY